MCLAVYVASDAPLPERVERACAAFWLRRVADSEGVCKQFRRGQVYYAGSHEGCGCGFSKASKDGDELEQCQQNDSLVGVLSRAVCGGANVQLFTLLGG